MMVFLGMSKWARSNLSAATRGRSLQPSSMARPHLCLLIGKVPPRRLALRKATNLDARCLQLGGVLAEPRSEFLKLQFHLLDEPLAALGARPEHLALHLGDHQLKMRDHRLGAGQPGARLD